MEQMQREAFKRIGFSDEEILRIEIQDEGLHFGPVIDNQPPVPAYVFIACSDCGHEHLIDEQCPPLDEPCDVIGCSHL